MQSFGIPKQLYQAAIASSQEKRNSIYSFMNGSKMGTFSGYGDMTTQ